jgi:hypothetical protein
MREKNRMGNKKQRKYHFQVVWHKQWCEGNEKMADEKICQLSHRSYADNA